MKKLIIAHLLIFLFSYSSYGMQRNPNSFNQACHSQQDAQFDHDCNAIECSDPIKHRARFDYYLQNGVIEIYNNQSNPMYAQLFQALQHNQQIKNYQNYLASLGNEDLETIKHKTHDDLLCIENLYNSINNLEPNLYEYDNFFNNPALANYIPVDSSCHQLLTLLHNYAEQKKVTITWQEFDTVKKLLEHQYPDLDNFFTNPNQIQKIISLVYLDAWQKHKADTLNQLIGAHYTLEQQIQYQNNTIDQFCYPTASKIAYRKKNGSNVLTNAPIKEQSLTENLEEDNKATMNQIIEPIKQAEKPAQKEAPEKLVKNQKTATQTTAQKSQKKLSPQQRAAAAQAQQRAQQSRLDKERHEQKKAQEKELALMLIEDKLAQKQKIKNVAPHAIQSNEKKSKKKKSDLDDKILQDAIADNQIISHEESLEDIFSELDVQIDSIVKFNCSFLNEQDQFNAFVINRTNEIRELGARKEIQRKNNLKLLCKAKKEDRQNLKEKLEKKLAQDFLLATQDERNTHKLLQTYEIITRPENIHKFNLYVLEQTQKDIESAEAYLALQNSHIRWYLALDQELYKKIKDNYLTLQHSVYIESKKLEAEYANDDKSETVRVSAQTILGKKMALLNGIEKFHKFNGILDISKLIYWKKSHDEIKALGKISPDALLHFKKIIRDTYCHNPEQFNMHCLAVRIVTLLNQAYINPDISFIQDIITASKAILNEYNQNIANLDIEIFYRLQCSQEMVLNQFTEDQIADITKVQISIVEALDDFYPRKK